MTRPASRGSVNQSGTVPAIGQGPFRRFQNVRGANVIRSGQDNWGAAAGEGLMTRGRRRRPEKPEIRRAHGRATTDNGGKRALKERHGADIHGPQARSQGVRARQGSRRNAEPDRSPEGLLRSVPADGPTEGWASKRGLAG